MLKKDGNKTNRANNFMPLVPSPTKGKHVITIFLKFRVQHHTFYSFYYRFGRRRYQPTSSIQANKPKRTVKHAVASTSDKSQSTAGTVQSYRI